MSSNANDDPTGDDTENGSDDHLHSLPGKQEADEHESVLDRSELDDADPIDDDESEDHLDEITDEDLDGDEEFSLDQLTEAYAKVIRGNNADPSASEDDADNRSDEGAPSADKPTLSRAALDSDDPADPDEPSERDLDAEDNAACPVSPESIVESILFVGAPKDTKLTTRKIAAILRDVSPKEVSKIVKNLNKKYEAERAVYRIKNDKGNLQMHLHESMQEFQQEFFGRNKPVRLSQHAIDVMAVVAYNQPVTREQVEKIRAKPSGGILSQLVRRNLIDVAPADQFQDKLRRYSTTEKFLDLFHLEDIADLPQSHEVSDLEELAD